MANTWLIVPLAICFLAALLAGLFGLRGLNRRYSVLWLSWGLASAPLTAFIIFFFHLNLIEAGNAVTWQVSWMPTLGLQASLYFDGLSALFALLVTGIGALVILYTGYYFNGDPGAWRFLAYIFLFMTAMLGVVLAGDIITLIVFWEGTSITSFLLIAYKYKDEAARRGGFKSLLITGLGGIALLAGLLFIAYVTGSTDLAGILASGEALRASPFYLVILGLVAMGAFTKSAQSPAHIWLPEAMSAPTPASAYLHSATMVKAGIYLMARLNPVLGATEAWFWLLSLFGLVTMLTGAYLGIKQNDLKALLAYSTVSQLGMLMMLIGQNTSIAYKALVIGIIAHALYKSALFLVAGIVDHAAGTRDLRRLGGLRRALPVTFVVAAVAALSMAGLPPLFGFLAKETLLATVAHPGLTRLIDAVFPALAVIAGALIMVQAGIFLIDTFLRKPRDAAIRLHLPPLGMALAPAIPAILSLALGVVPESRGFVNFLANAAEAAYAAEVEVSLAIWAGITVPLLLSAAAISLGVVLFYFRTALRYRMQLVSDQITANRLYEMALQTIDKAALLVSRVQNGKLRLYLAIIFMAMAGLVFLFGATPQFGPNPPFDFTLQTFQDELAILRLFTLFFIIATAFASVILKRDLPAILAVGASGLSVAVIMVLEPAPDIALVQVVVDILMTIILVLLLTRLPRPQRERAAEFTFRQSRAGLLRDGLIAAAGGLMMTVLVWAMLITRPRQSIVTPFYEQYTHLLSGATDIVGAILLDFRALDTFFEIAVFGAATLGVYTLLRYASREAGDVDQTVVIGSEHRPRTMGIGELRSSPFVRVLAYVILPLSMIVAITHLIFGHDQPGDGFSAGVIVSLAVGLWYVVLGYDETKRQLPWLRSLNLIGIGLLLVMINATMTAIVTGPLFTHVDYGALLGISLPAGMHLTSSFLFDVAIFLTVLGGATLLIDTLGRPKDSDLESARKIDEITAMETVGKVTREETLNIPFKVR